jgi:DNA-binding response OmpR family regulator
MAYILIAEDDRDILLLIQRRLELGGYTEVWTTMDGQEALDQALEQPPALLILDIMLPHVDGLSICQTVKQEFGPQAPPVIVISARGSRENIEEGRAAGADVYLVKPFAPRDLVAHIDRLLDR